MFLEASVQRPTKRFMQTQNDDVHEGAWAPPVCGVVFGIEPVFGFSGRHPTQQKLSFLRASLISNLAYQSRLCPFRSVKGLTIEYAREGCTEETIALVTMCPDRGSAANTSGIWTTST